jgi:hypothetical protein
MLMGPLGLSLQLHLGHLDAAACRQTRQSIVKVAAAISRGATVAEPIRELWPDYVMPKLGSCANILRARELLMIVRSAGMTRLIQGRDYKLLSDVPATDRDGDLYRLSPPAMPQALGGACPWRA